ncbi:hypothetical protein LP421_15200 [Rhizobium sp. RCAM05350]|nr:hypothetical protein LP421_15200 [Rhizobium sp. RCAM05350]
MSANKTIPIISGIAGLLRQQKVVAGLDVPQLASFNLGWRGGLAALRLRPELMFQKSVYKRKKTEYVFQL